MNHQAPLTIDHTRPELQGFEEYYATRIAPPLAERVEEQRKARIWALVGGVVGLLGLVLLAWKLWPSYKTGSEWAFFGTFAYVAIWLMTSLWKLWSLGSSVKVLLLKEVSAFFGFKYQQVSRSHNLKEFHGSGLIPSYHKASTEDHFSGHYEEVEFEFFECFLSEEKEDGENGKTTSEVYHGVLFHLSFPKSFSGQTTVLNDRGRIKNALIKMKGLGERVHLEDPRFEKLFDVWGTDQIEARYLLTPLFMERVVELAGAFGSSRIELCFKNNRLLISVPVSKDQFEGGGMFENVQSKKRVETLVNEMIRIFDIVNMLKLNLKTTV